MYTQYIDYIGYITYTYTHSLWDCCDTPTVLQGRPLFDSCDSANGKVPPNTSQVSLHN